MQLKPMEPIFTLTAPLFPPLHPHRCICSWDSSYTTRVHPTFQKFRFNTTTRILWSTQGPYTRPLLHTTPVAPTPAPQHQKLNPTLCTNALEPHLITTDIWISTAIIPATLAPSSFRAWPWPHTYSSIVRGKAAVCPSITSNLVRCSKHTDSLL